MTLLWGLDFLHVLFGALWLGGAFFASLVAGPALGRSPVAEREIGAAFAAATARYFRIVGTLAILLGLGIGWQEQRVNWVFWASLILAIALFGWGEAVLKRHWAKMPGIPEAERKAYIGRGVTLSVVEQVGFLILLGFMGMMRYAAGP